MNFFMKSAWATVVLLITFCLHAKAAEELIAEHVFATAGNINTAVNGATNSPLYVRIGSLTGGSGTVSITAIRVFAVPSTLSLTLTSATGTDNQSVPENLEIADVVYTYGGTADGYAIEWENTADDLVETSKILVRK